MPDQINELSKFHTSTQILHGSALFSGKIYTAGKVFTQSLFVTVVTNLKSADDLVYNVRNICNRFDEDGKTNPLVTLSENNQ